MKKKSFDQKFWLAVFMFYCLPFFTFSQINYSSGAFNITIPAGFPSPIYPIRPAIPFTRPAPGPSTFVFIEFGDGQFATSVDTYPAIRSLNFVHYYNLYPRQYPKAAFTSVYDPSTRPRPRSEGNIYSLADLPTLDARANPTSLHLLHGDSLAITTSTVDNRISLSDTQYIIALTYKVSTGSVATIDFKYGNLFSVDGIPRTYNGESYLYLSPNTYRLKRLLADNAEHTIFITVNNLSTAANIGDTSSLKATLEYGQRVATKTLRMPVLPKGQPHDPNHLVSTPACILFDDYSELFPISYFLDFQNIGDGNVRDSIITKTFLPVGVIAPGPLRPINVTEINFGGYTFATPGLSIINESGIYTLELSGNRTIIAQYIRPFLFVKIFKKYDKYPYPYPVSPLLYSAPRLSLYRSGYIKFLVNAFVNPSKVIGWSSVKFDNQPEEYTEPSFSQFATQCPCSCTDSIPKNKIPNWALINQAQGK